MIASASASTSSPVADSTLVLLWRAFGTVAVVTPFDLELLQVGARAVQSSADEFTREFYATLFELDPSLRRLFPDRLDAQRDKLLAELNVLIEHATAVVDGSTIDSLVDEADALGTRHDVYGVTARMYESVGVAFLAALREVVPNFDDDHARAWSRLYRLVSGAMQQA